MKYQFFREEIEKYYQKFSDDRNDEFKFGDRYYTRCKPNQVEFFSLGNLFGYEGLGVIYRIRNRETVEVDLFRGLNKEQSNRLREILTFYCEVGLLTEHEKYEYLIADNQFFEMGNHLCVPYPPIIPK